MQARKWGCEFEQLTPPARAAAYAKIFAAGFAQIFLIYASLYFGIWGAYAFISSIIAALFISRHYRLAESRVAPYFSSPFDDYMNALFLLLVVPSCCLFVYLGTVASDASILHIAEKNGYFFDFLLRLGIFRLGHLGHLPVPALRAAIGVLFLAYSTLLTVIPSAINAYDMRKYWVSLFSSDPHPVQWLFTACTSLFLCGFLPATTNLGSIIKDYERISQMPEGVPIYLVGLVAPVVTFWIIFSAVLGYLVFKFGNFQGGMQRPPK